MDLRILISSSLVAALVLLSSIHNFYKAEGRIVSEEEDLELETQLKILNKPPTKTIVATNGDIVDCIDIYRQLAFNNPLLKNHKHKATNGDIVDCIDIYRQLAFNNPLLKNHKHKATNGDIVDCIDIYRQLAFNNPLLKNHKHKIKRIIKQELLLDGANASSKSISALEHYYNESHCPFGTVPVIRTTKKQLVYPELFGDADTLIFAYWTGDGYRKMGCFNMLCSGFVLVNHEIPLGASLANTGRAFLGSRVVRVNSNSKSSYESL
ncbi:uncharacterized protein LOC113346403 [Papaver somniferum]|uniref:uncharacterized protein LOC113346403 n=1 Tax=Papaver somniferum TaxID=3469 RepID=UPI000E70602A|nr:uncharacterized protein LOC113346403 [Papaver somniferum]